MTVDVSADKSTTMVGDTVNITMHNDGDTVDVTLTVETTDGSVNDSLWSGSLSKDESKTVKYTFSKTGDYKFCVSTSSEGGGGGQPPHPPGGGGNITSTSAGRRGI